MKEIRKETIPLKKGLKQKVIVWDKKDIAMARKDKIYVNEDFFRIFNKKERETVIYHERHHITKVGKLFLNLSNLFMLIGAFLISIFLFMIIIKMMGNLPFFRLNYELPKINNLLFIIFGLIFIFISSLYRWLSETMCDANAFKNSGKKVLINALEKAYKYNKKKMSIIKCLENNYLLHVPKNLRLKIIKSWDE